MTPDERLDLPVHDVDAALARRIGARAARRIEREARLSRTPWLLRADRIYEAALEPALVTLVAATHLGWALLEAARLLL